MIGKEARQQMMRIMWSKTEARELEIFCNGRAALDNLYLAASEGGSKQGSG